MSTKRTRGPQWKILNLILLLGGGALILERRLNLTSTGREIALIVLVLAVYGLIAGWVHANAVALQDMNDAAYQQRPRDSGVIGTPEAPTATQARFSEALSLYRRESPGK